ncbi:Protein kinase domain-containing protein [Psidium guajava]|nr:Protein kinase domain-containing protein [Psidium guajava]
MDRIDHNHTDGVGSPWVPHTGPKCKTTKHPTHGLGSGRIFPYHNSTSKCLRTKVNSTGNVMKNQGSRKNFDDESRVEVEPARYSSLILHSTIIEPEYNSVLSKFHMARQNKRVTDMNPQTLEAS